MTSLYSGKMRHAHDGRIYFVALREDGPVKIGYCDAALVVRRYCEFARIYGVPCVYPIAIWRGSIADEARLHHHLRHIHLAGEVYPLNDTILNIAASFSQETCQELASLYPDITMPQHVESATAQRVRSEHGCQPGTFSSGSLGSGAGLTDASRQRLSKIPTFHGRPWSDAELAAIKSLAGNKSDAQIAKRLGRSVGAIQNLRKRLGILRRAAPARKDYPVSQARSDWQKDAVTATQNLGIAIDKLLGRAL